MPPANKTCLPRHFLSAVPFQLKVIPYRDLRAELARAEQGRRRERYAHVQRLISTANGRYHFGRANLNDLVAQSDYVDVRPVSFRNWLRQVWGPASPE